MTDRPQKEAQFTAGTFTVEFDAPMNRTVLINLLDVQARGAYAGRKLPSPPSGTMGTIQDIPGQRMKVIPKEMRAVLYDPLEEKENKHILDQLWAVAQDESCRVINMGRPFGPVPRTEFMLNPDMLKTLILELKSKVEEERVCRLVDGAIPSAADIAAMPGRQLYDPQNKSSRKPTYVEDVPAFESRIAAGW
jgi:hypothetical protein